MNVFVLPVYSDPNDSPLDIICDTLEVTLNVTEKIREADLVSLNGSNPPSFVILPCWQTQFLTVVAPERLLITSSK